MQRTCTEANIFIPFYLGVFGSGLILSRIFDPCYFFKYFCFTFYYCLLKVQYLVLYLSHIQYGRFFFWKLASLVHNDYPAYTCNVPSVKYNLLLLLAMPQHIYALGQFYTAGMKDTHTSHYSVDGNKILLPVIKTPRTGFLLKSSWIK
jgi:hypothetical protein